MRRKLVGLFVAVALSTLASTVKADPVCLTNSKIGAQMNLPVYEWVDRTKPRKGTIVAVPGLTLYAMCWDQFAKHLASQGYHVYSLDLRGFGRWRTDGAKFGSSKIEIGQSEQDLLDLVTDLRQEHPTQPLFCLGESLGSNMALDLVSEHPELTNGSILASPCYKNRVHAKPMKWAGQLAIQMVRPNRPINLEPYSAPYLTNDPALAKACDNDPMIYRKMTPAELVKIDILNDKAFSAAKKLPADYPILMIAGTQDAMFKSNELPKGIEKFGTHNVSLTLLPGRGHLLLEHQRVNKQIAVLVDGWLAHHSSTAAVASAPGATTRPASSTTTTTTKRPASSTTTTTIKRPASSTTTNMPKTKKNNK